MKKYLNRKEIPDIYKWNLKDIYKTEEAWLRDYKKIENGIKELKQFQGKLKSSKNLLKCVSTAEKLYSILDNVYVYAHLKRDEDTRDNKGQELSIKASNLITKLVSTTSFIEPEIALIPKSKINSWLIKEKKLSNYNHFLNNIQRRKNHFLSITEENLISKTREISKTSSEVFAIFNNADLKFPKIKDEKERLVPLTKGKYGAFLENPKRQVRKEAFTNFLGTYRQYNNTLATTLNSVVSKNKFYSGIRKFPSSLESRLNANNISVSVYEGLIKTVNKNIPLLEKYLNLKKSGLKLKDLHMYDLYAPVISEPPKKIKYEKATELVLEALNPLGSEYRRVLKKGIESGWVDVFETEGKMSGAYCAGSYQTHPYVLLNYQESLNDVFTLAHELGHAMHSYFSCKHQTYINSEYSIFTAEIASTFNEVLLLNYLLQKVQNKEEKIYLLTNYLEHMRTTIFRQTMFAEFEKNVHEYSEAGQALTAEFLNKEYFNLVNKYYGKAVKIDRDIEVEWSYIPHFYSSFYVYQYATGLSAAVALANRVMKEGEPAVQKYLNFLKSGGSDYPLKLLTKAGVDFSTPMPVQEAFNDFSDKINELEELLR